METRIGQYGVPPKSEFSRRLKNIRSRMEKRDIDILVIYSGPGSLRFGQRGHVMYVSGYEPYFGDTMVILPQNKGMESLLEVDEPHHFPQGCTWIENVKSSIDHVNTLKEYLLENKLEKPKIGIVGEYSMSPSLYARFREELRFAHFELASDILEEERAIKSEYEVECIREAAKIAYKGIEAAAKFAQPGVLEAGIKGEIERVCRIEGSQSFPHYTMVLSGKRQNHLDWWLQGGNRKLKDKDPWLLDFGTMYNNYCCDISRPFTLGPPSQKQIDTFELLRHTQEAAKNAAQVGVLTSDLNKASSNVMKEALGIEDLSVPLGHGVGLEAHEWPFIGYHGVTHDDAYKDSTLKENMVISLEVALYYPDIGMQQIEDQFLVTTKGLERLNNIPQKIIECS